MSKLTVDRAPHSTQRVLVIAHPSEQERYDRGGKEPLVQMRFQHFHHNYRNKGHPWMEVS